MPSEFNVASVESMRVKVDQHESPAGMDWQGGLIASLRTSPGNHCLATFNGIDGAVRDISPQVADRFAAAWNLCQGMPTQALKELSKADSPMATALKSVLEAAYWYAYECGGSPTAEAKIAAIHLLQDAMGAARSETVDGLLGIVRGRSEEPPRPEGG